MMDRDRGMACYRQRLNAEEGNPVPSQRGILGSLVWHLLKTFIVGSRIFSP